MNQTDKKLGLYKRFQLSVMNNMAPSFDLEKDGLTYWRIRILFVILFTGVLIGTFVMVPVLANYIKKDMWGLVIFDTMVWLTGSILLFSPSLGYTVRAGVGALLLYIVGVFILISLGPLSGGPIWLFAFAILVGIYFESKAAIMALIINAITLTTIGMLIQKGIILQDVPFFINLESMIIAIGVFILLNSICSMSVVVMVKGLVLSNQKERALVDDLEIEQFHLTETKKKLESEIEERKQAEEALQESERLYRLLADNVSDNIWSMDMEMNFTYTSPSVFQMRGYSVEEAKAQSLEETMTPSSLEVATRVIAEELELHNGGKRPKDRSRTIEAELYCKDGSTVWTEIEANFIYDGNGQPKGIIGVTRDITERKRTESQLLRSKKLASLGDMVAGVAHEISTPLGVSLMASSFLNDTTNELVKQYSPEKESPEFEKYAKKALEASTIILTNLERASDLLSSFKHVAIDQVVEEKRRFNLKTNIEDTLSSLRPKYKRTNHTVTVECPDNIETDNYPGAFSQIITNLVMNSLTHGFEGIDQGKITIKAKKNENMLFFTYQDTGKGMDGATLSKLFDPFFTTKRSKGGIGLGMHIVYNLVSKTLHGAIQCRSLPGKGMECHIEIPLKNYSDNNAA
jgi:PAS domain S-box-containing protein